MISEWCKQGGSSRGEMVKGGACVVNGSRTGRRIIGDTVARYARIGKSTKRLFRQQSVTRRREGLG